MKKPFKYNPQDPRPEWMQEQQWATEGSSDRFRQWARENLHIDINKQLAYDQARGDQKALQVLAALGQGIPFVLYKDPQRFILILPKFKAIVSIFPGRQSTTELLDEKQFQNRVKMNYVYYPKFTLPSKELTLSAMQLILNDNQENVKLPARVLRTTR